MIETEEQRRWWFANHPEYSSSRRGGKDLGKREEKEDDDRIRPEDVDAYVDESLKYETGLVAELLKSVKREFGTEGASNQFHGKLASLDGADSLSDARSSSDGEDAEEREATFWDAVLKGIENTLQDWERWFGLGGGLARPSRALARNLERAGSPRPPGHDAHHIVAAGDSRFRHAIEAREILEKFNIHINDATNGVWLPNKPGVGSAAYHRVIHAKEYYRKVARLLRLAKTREEAIQILQQIGQGLSDNTFYP